MMAKDPSKPKKPTGTRFGVRLFTLTPTLGHGRTPVPFSEAGLYEDNTTLVDDLVTIAEDNLNKRHFGRLVYNAVDDEDSGSDEGDLIDDGQTVPAITIEKVSKHAHRIDFEFRWGREGSHDLAMSRDGIDAELKGKAASNSFYAWIYLPKDGGSAILAAECRGRLCVGTDLAKYLSVLMKERSEQPGNDHGWWKLRTSPASDDRHLGHLIRHGQPTGLVVKKIDSKKVGRSTEALVLRQNWIAPKRRDRAKAILLGWADKKPRDFGITDLPPEGTAPEQVSALLGESIVETDWDTGAIVFENEDQTQSTYSPQDIRDVFIYPVGQGARPGPNRYHNEVKSRLEYLMEPLKVEVHLD